MSELLSRRMQQHVAVFRRRRTVAPRLEEILHAYANFTFHAADRLLQHPRELWIGGVDHNRILQSLVMIIHRSTFCWRDGLTNLEQMTRHEVFLLIAEKCMIWLNAAMFACYIHCVILYYMESC